ncbi:hypothetical protein AX16_010822 [Volvariella volvacea WC 439]|nr:hypothetical protein AX16_010822 [Volvariella volvacea WC 439]
MNSPLKRHAPEPLRPPPPPLETAHSLWGLDFNLGFSLLLAGRLVLALTPLPGVVKNNQQLSNALTSYANLREGVYLFNNGIDPYNGGTFRHSPLFLSLFSTILPNSRAAASLLWTFSDGVGAWALVKTLRARQRVRNPNRDPLVAAL